jgi:16S rRNA (uracil1498-N3)-methyltransferase
VRRFHLPDLRHNALSGGEAHHCVQVLRLKPGDTLTVFDGRGQEAHCRIAGIEDGCVQLTPLQQTATPPLPRAITLAQAIPKKNMDLIVQKATELGVTRIAPLMSERTLAQPPPDGAKLERWRAISLEACKQSGNNWLPDIEPPRPARTFLAGLADQPAAWDLKLIASLQPDARPLKSLLAESGERTRIHSVLVLIGPEGDFTPAELALAKSAGCRALSLGPLVLRAETAALYALSILHHELQVQLDAP